MFSGAKVPDTHVCVCEILSRQTLVFFFRFYRYSVDQQNVVIVVRQSLDGVGLDLDGEGSLSNKSGGRLVVATEV